MSDVLQQLIEKRNSAKQARDAVVNQLAAQDGYIQALDEMIALLTQDASSTPEMPHETEA